MAELSKTRRFIPVIIIPGKVPLFPFIVAITITSTIRANAAMKAAFVCCPQINPPSFSVVNFHDNMKSLSFSFVLCAELV